MQHRRILAGAALLLGVLCTTATAQGQETSLASARERVKASPASADAALAYGRALRRAGHEGEALRELRRGLGLAAGKPDLAARLTWEVARTQVAQRQFETSMATCGTLAKVPGASA